MSINVCECICQDNFLKKSRNYFVKIMIFYIKIVKEYKEQEKNILFLKFTSVPTEIQTKTEKVSEVLQCYDLNCFRERD